MPPSLFRLSPRAPLKRWPLLLLGGAAALGTMVAVTRGGPSHATVLGELASARPARALSPRFSIPVEYNACSVLPARPDETVPREACGAGADADAGWLDRFEALADAGESSDPDSLQASALLAILGDDTEQAADAAIARLSRALRLSRRPVPILVDLSGAYLVRAQRTQNPRDLLEALEHALEALEVAPRNPDALFNAALAMQMVGLDEQAGIAWEEYLQIDSTSEWAAEARERTRVLRHPETARAPEPGAPEAEVRAYAARYPQEARLLGMDTVLGRWGRAVEAGDTAGAAKLLQLADDLGFALRIRGGDLSLMDAVGAIRAVADDPEATRTLARAHRRYATGQTLLATQDSATLDTFASVLRTRLHSPALMRSAEITHAATLVNAGRYAQADSAFEDLLTRIDSVRYPALAGRARANQGTGLNRDSKWDEARVFYRSAARLFERARETESMAANHQMDGEAAYNQRDTLAAYRAMHRGLMTLRGFRRSVRLHNTLFMLANSAATDGMLLAAAKIQNEDVSVARRLSVPSSTLESLLGRASVRALTGRPREAAQDLEAARSLMAALRGSESQGKLVATGRYLRALVATDGASLAGLDSAIGYFEKTNDFVLLLPALMRRADVRLAQGQVAAATDDLEAATRRIRDVSHDQKYAYLRAAMMDQARNYVDRLVMLHVRGDDAAAALRTLEQGRVSFAVDSLARVPRKLAAPPGQRAVEYALIGDTLLTWTVVGDDIRLRRDTLDRGDLVLRIERVTAALEYPARSAVARADLERLYDLLVRPAKNRLGRSGTPLVILADGEVAGVPFPALRDSAGGDRYLVEDHPLRFAASLAGAARAPSAADGPARPALLVADPAFDRLRYPRLDPLEGAQAEVNSLAALYPRNVKLSGAQATRDAFLENAERAGMIHYAGHALFDDARPEWSALVLADEPLTAEAVNDLPLGGVRLVVLAACRTLRSREGRSGGFAGLSGALLGAGAGGVVGSLWEVNDASTQPFMLAFHRAYQKTDDPAAALRDAQLEMLRSNDPALRSPAAWGGFRYVSH